MRDVQARLQRTFDGMAREGIMLRSPDSIAASLQPAERCLLQHTAVLNGTSAQLSQSACDAAFADVQAEPGMHLESCWLHELNVNDTRAVTQCLPTAANMATHRSALGHWQRLNDQGRHLLLGVLARYTLVILGDSLMRMLYEAAQCEVWRAAELPKTRRQALLSNLHYVDIGYTVEGLSARLVKQYANASNVVAVASIGVHYNNQRSHSRGAVEAFDIRTRASYVQDVQTLARALEHFVSAVTPAAHRTAMLITPPLQHFETWDGTYERSIFSTKGFGCRPLNETALAALRADSTTASPNVWRSADLLEAAHTYAPHVLVAPFHSVSNGLWDQHPGQHGTKRFQKHNYVYKPTLDCTHFCYSPFLYEPLWWAIGQAADQMAPRLVETAA